MSELVGWYPIAALDDLAARHVFAGELGGHELAVWRADDGFVNVWEDRCLHRGVRLSVGLNDGAELQCQYHGWRYANRSAGCIYIPAHPGDAPARSLCARTYPVVLRYGLVWTTLRPDREFPLIAALEAQPVVVARALPFHASVEVVVAHLLTLAAALTDPGPEVGGFLAPGCEPGVSAPEPGADGTDPTNGGSAALVSGSGRGSGGAVPTFAASEGAVSEGAVSEGAGSASGCGPDGTSRIGRRIADRDSVSDGREPATAGPIEQLDTTRAVVLGAAGGPPAVCLLQPCDSERTIVRPLLVVEAASVSQLRQMSAAMEALRRSVETGVASRSSDQAPVGHARSRRPLVVRGGALIADSESMPGSQPTVPGARPRQGRDEASELTDNASDSRTPVDQRVAARLTVEVVSKRVVAQGIVAFELAAVNEPLPAPLPGDHIDIALPNGLVRQYSLTNPPGHTNTYRVAVLRTEPSRGGSAWLHDNLQPGDLLEISPPRHGFVLRRDALHTVLVAGGIGVTPLISMAAALHHQSMSFELHYFVRSNDHIALAEELANFVPRAHLHVGLDATGTGAELSRLLAIRPPHAQLYACGPVAMLELTRRTATEAGWPESSVHVEYFANPNTIRTDRSFEIVLARSGRTLHVPAGASALEVLRINGAVVDSSCEQGACGTCVVRVLEGTPDHQDVYFSPSERAAGDRIATCVSRALGERLVLDL